MKTVTKLLCLVLTLATVVTGVLVFAGAENEATRTWAQDFEKMTVGTATRDTLTAGGLKVADASDKAGVAYEIVADSGNQYLKFTQGTEDPCFAPTALSNFKTATGNQFSYSLALAKDASFDVVPAYNFRIRIHGTEDAKDGGRQDITVFSLTSSGEIKFNSSTGIFLQENTFTTVSIAIDFGDNSRYATVTGFVEGVPIQTWQLDVQRTNAYNINNALNT